MAKIHELVKARFPWMPTGLVNLYVRNFIEFGDHQIARAAVRDDPRHAKLFPGIKRDDGSLRMSEGEYLSTVEGFRIALNDYGVPGAQLLTTKRIKSMIEGGKSVNEFRNQLAMVFTQVASNLTEVRKAYAEEFGIGAAALSLRALFASAIDADIDPVVFEQKIRKAQIRGEAMFAGFDIPIAESGRLAEFGLTQESARSFYTQARTLMPTLGQLVARHNDPDDEFDLTELTDAVVFGDPDQQQRLRRLFSAESSLFTPNALFNVRGGRVEGLVPD